MIKIVCKDRGLYYSGVLFVDNIRLCDVLINRDKFGKFPYEFNHVYRLNYLHYYRYSISDDVNVVFNGRSFQLHTGNSVNDSKGCVLVGYHPFISASDSYDYSLLQMSRYAFKMLMYNINDKSDIIFI